MLLQQLILNLAGDRLQMGFGCSRTNHKEISERGNPAEIQRDNLFRFLVRGKFRT